MKDGKHKELSASDATEHIGLKECKLLTTQLPEGLGPLTFCPPCRGIALATSGQQKIKRKVPLRSLRLERSGR
jgi:hypothetical protein